MKAVILAAGRGQRLSPMTDDRPKCMIEFEGRSLLARQLDTLQSTGVHDVLVITGYRADRIQALSVRTQHNPYWAETNMVATLMCAADEFDGSDDVLIAYADILYERRIIEAMRSATAVLATAVDLGWRELWMTRMADPLKDAESLKLDSDGYIAELGKKPNSLAEIQGQYIGLTRVAASFCRDFIGLHGNLDPAARYDGKDLPNMYMTSYLQCIIDSGVPLKAVQVKHGWIEIDTVGDLVAYSELLRTGQMQRLYSTNR